MIAAIITVALVIISDNESVITVLDGKDEEIISDNVSNYGDNENAAYLDVVLTEAVEVIAAKKTITAETAKKELSKNDYTIYTNFDAQISNTLKEACKKYSDKINIGGAITNLDGDLLAVASVSRDNINSVNYSLKKSPPYSTFKPLAVYAPAIESKKITWSTLFEDSPYKILEDEYGIKRDWPANATGIYSNKQVTPFIAIKESLNTVAVKCLSQYGVNNSIDFLKTKFNINLDLEQYKSTIYGEEEVIGNIALGYTNAGCSPVEMAGYYQIFANGGYYKAPKTIKKIVDDNGITIYENKEEAVQVISSETAYIMNELLKGVITPGGTGEKAYCADIAVAGKTGTGDDNFGNWFVGVTPEFSCAVWHSEYNKTNYATQIFSDITKKANINNKVFMTSDNVVKKIYCTESGKLLSSKCKSVEIGYFATNNIPSVCDLH